ncbi:MAG: c-type cytochrome [Dehalococcoidia bacterium]
MTKKRWFCRLQTCAVVGLLGLGFVTAQGAALESSKQKPSPTLVRSGKRLYERRCLFCHGPHGEGNGPVSRGIFPKPRSFTQGIFKIRSTPSGSPPTDEDLLQTLKRGMPGTMMPSFSNLKEEQLWSLVYYVKSFFTEPDAPSPEPFPIPEERPLPSAESITRGQDLFLEAECWSCHGLWGRGDGPSSEEMVDDWGYPIRVADLNQPKLLRGGSSARELYRAIATGVGGTPMPSYGDSINSEQMWDLVNYLQSRMTE